MRASEMMRRAGAREEAIKSLLDSGKDLDVHAVLTKQWQATEFERRQYRNKAYGKGDVSIPVMPGFSIDYDGADTLIADLVCPVVPGNIARKFTKFARRDTSRILNLKIGPKGQIPEAAFDVSTATYSEVGYGEKQPIDNNAIAQQGATMDLMRKHSMTLMRDLMLGREYRVATLLSTIGNYGTGCSTALSSTNRWDVGPSTSTADPVKDIRVTAGTAVGLAGAFNTMIVSKPVAAYLRTHPKVIAAAGGKSSDRVVSLDELKTVFDLENIYVGDAKYDTAGNTSTASYTYMWGKGCMLLRTKLGASEHELSFAKTFRHTDFQFRDERDGTTGVRGTTILIATHEDAEIVVASDAGYLLDTVIS